MKGAHASDDFQSTSFRAVVQIYRAHITTLCLTIDSVWSGSLSHGHDSLYIYIRSGLLIQQRPPSTRPSAIPGQKCPSLPPPSGISYVPGHLVTAAAVCEAIRRWVMSLSKASQLVEDSSPNLRQERGHLICVRRQGEAEDTTRILSLT